MVTGGGVYTGIDIGTVRDGLIKRHCCIERVKCLHSIAIDRVSGVYTALL